MTMRALTVRNPWAWAIIHAGKDIENRTWSTSYRGPLVIHAAARLEAVEYQRVCSWMRQHVDVLAPAPDRLIGQALVGVVDLVDCVRDSASRWAMPDQWHWVLRDPRTCEPRLARGKLGLWTIE